MDMPSFLKPKITPLPGGSYRIRDCGGQSSGRTMEEAYDNLKNFRHYLPMIQGKVYAFGKLWN